ncbi:unnamed protein product [Protopolystoma xenopodis]|uniref:Uncharacterized protein n=1 Tax=Protopolystoma xenopodis TaxID=117903 RepID=A0A3S5FEZ2_9PLAT|nr:unnamed protein product [Protopolystoma xenopodis]
MHCFLVLPSAYIGSVYFSEESLTSYYFSGPWPSEFCAQELLKSFPRQRIDIEPRDTGLPSFMHPFNWLIAHTVGIKLAYPGCMTLFNSLTREFYIYLIISICLSPM